MKTLRLLKLSLWLVPVVAALATGAWSAERWQVAKCRSPRWCCRAVPAQPGGHLARATYSAYNAGPGGVARYRGVRQSPTWKKVDEAFWTKFQAVSSGPELAVKSCYGA